ncbi:EF-hand domain-containing protein [Pseudomonas aeruginosa]|nr:EF-hand domain-containing protein [Pseudomonas aeruginosa]
MRLRETPQPLGTWRNFDAHTDHYWTAGCLRHGRRPTSDGRRREQADANHDGKLTKEEATKGMPRVAQHFAEIDTDGKGYVTLDQLKTFMAQSQGQ